MITININLGKNIKILRERKGIEQQTLADILEVPRSTLACWENGIRTPKLEQIIKIADYFNVNLDIIYDDFDNAEPINVNSEIAKIPILGVIKAGCPIEAQENIVGYTDIPKDWIRGGKNFFGLKISGNSMTPNYLEGDIVIFESTNEFNNGDDCAVMVNGNDCTFKKVAKTDEGILLQPYNVGEYDLKFYSKDDIIKLPVKIIGVAREYRRKI